MVHKKTNHSEKGNSFFLVYLEKTTFRTYNIIKGDDSMEALICKNCGANKLIQKSNYMFCPYCESRFAVTKEELQNLFSKNHHSTLSHSGVSSTIALDDDVAKLLKKCKSDPRNARRYANLILDLDPDNEEALKYL